MKFLFLDDAKQANPARERMGKLVAVGGLIVDANKLASLESKLNGICLEGFGFPSGEMFKWSPGKTDWMRENLVGDKRAEFFDEILETCGGLGAKAVVAVCDISKRKANARASDHEVDAFLLTLERFHTHIRDDTGFLVVAKPSGGTKSENKFLAECIEHKLKGTDYVEFEKLAQNPVTMPSVHSRVLQAADLVVSTTTAMCAGNESYAAKVFSSRVKPIFISDWRGLVGNTGLKLHPNRLYSNIYHWVLGEDFRAEGSIGLPIPEASRPYYSDRLKY